MNKKDMLFGRAKIAAVIARRIMIATLLTLALPFCLLGEVLRELLNTLSEFRYLLGNIGVAWADTFATWRMLWRWTVNKQTKTGRCARHRTQMDIVQ